MPPIFPTAYSTLSAPALATFIGGKYALPGAQCKFLVRGVGDTYLITTPPNRYILRIYRPTHRTLPQITAEVELLLAAKAGGVSVSYPLPDTNHNFIQSLEAAEGPRHAVLFTYAEGEPASILTEGQLQHFGDQMARLHTISSTIRLSHPRWTFDPETTLTKPLQLSF